MQLTGRLMFSPVSIIILILTIIVAIDAAVVVGPTNTAGHHRVKRQFYDEGYAFGNLYGWQMGRVLGWILGCLLVLVCMCLPCICCLGIWFAGWFGFRRARQNSANATVAAVPVPPPQQAQSVPVATNDVLRPTTTVGVPPPRRRLSTADPDIEEMGIDGHRIQRVVYTSAADRFYERHPPASPGGGYYGSPAR